MIALEDLGTKWVSHCLYAVYDGGVSLRYRAKLISHGKCGSSECHNEMSTEHLIEQYEYRLPSNCPENAVIVVALS